ncbi:MAG TPA: ABC transporter ATP-binding protein [Devosiaceae bacterium]|jgi:oligopeptide/dipeptide ABC transporter ATP-binding protein|nr:ABC transporter ATP-binding protein [Devosiaceae bacterium]
MLRLENVVKDYPLRSGVFGGTSGVLRAVDGVSLDIAAGSTFGLVGESGCGKSTLSRMVLGLERRTAGRIDAAGRDPQELKGASLKAWRRDVQIIAQDPAGALPARMRVRRLLEEPWRIHRIEPPHGRPIQVAQLLSQVGLTERHGRAFPHQLSGGQRQRVVIARALALEPRLVVCDEPVSALDVSVQAQVLDLLRRLQSEYGLTYLFISHDLRVVRSMAAEIGVMFSGLLVERGPADAVYRRPAHPYTRELLNAMPSIDGGRRLRSVAFGPPAATLDGDARRTGCPYRLRCPLAIDRCVAERPPLRQVAPTRFSACHRAEEVLSATRTSQSIGDHK